MERFAHSKSGNVFVFLSLIITITHTRMHAHTLSEGGFIHSTEKSSDIITFILYTEYNRTYRIQNNENPT